MPSAMTHSITGGPTLMMFLSPTDLRRGWMQQEPRQPRDPAHRQTGRRSKDAQAPIQTTRRRSTNPSQATTARITHWPTEGPRREVGLASAPTAWCLVTDLATLPLPRVRSTRSVGRGLRRALSDTLGSGQTVPADGAPPSKRAHSESPIAVPVGPPAAPAGVTNWCGRGPETEPTAARPLIPGVLCGRRVRPVTTAHC